MKKVYFDYNIIIDHMERRVVDLFDIDRSKYEIYYSPAHLEEIAYSKKCGKLQRDECHFIELLSDLTENREIIPYVNCKMTKIDRPFGDEGIVFAYEDPIYCFNRVMESIEVNNYAEIGQKSVLMRGARKFSNMKPKTKQKKIEKIQKQDIKAMLYDDKLFDDLVQQVFQSMLLCRMRLLSMGLDTRGYV